MRREFITAFMLLVCGLAFAGPVHSATEYTGYAYRVLNLAGGGPIAYWRMSDGEAPDNPLWMTDEVGLDPNGAPYGTNIGVHYNNPSAVDGAMADEDKGIRAVGGTYPWSLGINWPTFQGSIPQWTVAFWVKPTGLGAGAEPVRKDTEDGSGNNNHILRVSHKKCTFRAGSATSTVSVNAPPNAPKLNRWNHVACVYDGELLHFYLNGLWMGSHAGDPNNQTTRNLGANPHHWLFGGRTPNPSPQFVPPLPAYYVYGGVYDDVAVWSRALGRDELRYMITAEWPTTFRKVAGFSSKKDELVAGITFDKGDGIEYVFNTGNPFTDPNAPPASGWLARQTKWAPDAPNRDLSALHIDEDDPNGYAVYFAPSGVTDVGKDRVTVNKWEVARFYPDTETAEVVFSVAALGLSPRITGFSIGPDDRYYFNLNVADKMDNGFEVESDFIMAIPKGSTDPNDAELWYEGDLHTTSHENIDGFHVIDDKHVLFSFQGGGFMKSEPSSKYTDGDIILYHMHGSRETYHEDNFSETFFDESFFSTGADADAVWINWVPEEIDHAELTHDGYGINCSPEPITITLMDGLGPMTNYAGYIAVVPISGSKAGVGYWSKIDAKGALGQYYTAAVYAFDPNDNGDVVLGYNVKGNVADPNNQKQDFRILGWVRDEITGEFSFVDIRQDATGPLTISPSGLVLTNNALSEPLPSPLPSYSAMTAATTSDLHLTAIGSDALDSKCQIIEGYEGVKDIKFKAAYTNPAYGAGANPRTIKLNSSDVAQDGVGTTTVSVSFTDGKSDPNTTLDLSYTDVGKIRLTAIDDSPDAVGSHGAAGMTGFADMVSMPHDIQIATLADPNGDNGVRASSAATEARFKKAGETFKIVVEALDPNDRALPSFGLETGGPDITLTHALVNPDPNAGGTVGALTSDPNWAVDPNNRVVGTISWNEVGVIKLKAELKDWLGDTTADFGPVQTGFIGRFYPDHFLASPGVNFQLKNGCGSSFTYMGQDFDFGDPNTGARITVTAMPKGSSDPNDVTTNYTGAFMKMDPNDLTNMSITSDPNSQLQFITTGVSAPTVDDNGDGSVDLVFMGSSGIHSTRPMINGLPMAEPNAAALANNLTLSIDIQDSDGVRYAGASPPTYETSIGFAGGNKLLFGRVYLGDAYGSELVPIQVPLEVQYYKDADEGWVSAEGLDTCTTLPTMGLAPGTDDPNDFLGHLDQGKTFSDGTGVANSSLTVDCGGQTGSVGVSLDISSAPHLQWDWDGNGLDGSPTYENPSANITCGIYTGHDEIIYLRELY